MKKNNLAVPPPPVAEGLPAKWEGLERICVDWQMRIVFEIGRSEGRVYFIPLTPTKSFDLHTLSVGGFDQHYQELLGYPMDRAGQLFTQYMKVTGATPVALTALKRVVKITPLDEEAIVMAKAEAAKKVAAKLAPAKEKAKKVKAEAGPKEPRITAASRFKELILAGGQTDDAIFATVQKEFGLDDSKRGYVAWYRNWLKKNHQGKVPEAMSGNVPVGDDPKAKKTKKK